MDAPHSDVLAECSWCTWWEAEDDMSAGVVCRWCMGTFVTPTPTVTYQQVG